MKINLNKEPRQWQFEKANNQNPPNIHMQHNLNIQNHFKEAQNNPN